MDERSLAFELHRVVPPPALTTRPNRRRSYAYFHEADHDVVVEPLPQYVDAAHPARYEPFGVGDHLTGKVQASRGRLPSDAVSTAGDREALLA